MTVLSPDQLALLWAPILGVPPTAVVPGMGGLGRWNIPSKRCREATCQFPETNLSSSLS